MDEINAHLAAAYLKVAYNDTQAELTTTRAALARLIAALDAEREVKQTLNITGYTTSEVLSALAAAREVLR